MSWLLFRNDLFCMSKNLMVSILFLVENVLQKVLQVDAIVCLNTACNLEDKTICTRNKIDSGHKFHEAPGLA